MTVLLHVAQLHNTGPHTSLLLPQFSSSAFLPSFNAVLTTSLLVLNSMDDIFVMAALHFFQYNFLLTTYNLNNVEETATELL